MDLMDCKEDMPTATTMARDGSLKKTVCSRGHIHPPWNTTGILRIAKCESVCGFCQKETKTAANLRKHVAIHIKNEGLDLSIAEGSSGRGRLEIPSSELERCPPSYASQDPQHSDNAIMSSGHLPIVSSSKSVSAPVVLMSMPPPPNPNWVPLPSSSSTSQLSFSRPYRPALPCQDIYNSAPDPSKPPDSLQLRHQKDPFWALREHNIATKAAWTAIPATEGFRILDLCKRLSVASSEEGVKVPCYNRKTLFDDEWQAHMRDVHGVFLLWPETWMRRIEVLDLEPFGGDIQICNEVIMAS